ncbi:hypothetical protein OSSY52_22270 [Tepiditoga spiralis]|uniref:CAAX prenyl protease 2/Lysostaphin resistance protein A-like domain-containing protein n=1 Tax=Tepiditoga spiralis TaxID=2108365 RepID=A0A7G1G9C0_9BACT|nr:type II CAAX endopeptidase family protein [Tepiditoga spiralis]BBE32086.1 hypothetical protein OSSY52_22270 [Tepiditoga spiralis]
MFEFERIKFRNFILYFFIFAVCLEILFEHFNINTENSILFNFFTDIFTLFWLLIKFKKNNIIVKDQYKISENKFEKKYILKLTISLIAISIMFSFLQDFIISFFHFPSLYNDKDLVNFYMKKRQPLEELFFAFNLIIFVPFVEELFFRFFLINRFALKWGIKKAVILSSTMFALMHPNFFGTFLFAIAVSIIYLETKSLKLNTFIHMLNNLTAYIFLKILFISNLFVYLLIPIFILIIFYSSKFLYSFFSTYRLSKYDKEFSKKINEEISQAKYDKL